MRSTLAFGIVVVAAALAAPAARAESVDREAVTAGRLTVEAPFVVLGRADGRTTMGEVEVLRLTVLEAWKGTVGGTLSVVLHGNVPDLRRGDELVAFLAPVTGEQIGLVGGAYHRTLGPAFYSLVRVSGDLRARWGDLVRAVCAGDRTALAHRLATEAAAGDRRLATDAWLDLANLAGLDLAAIMTTEEKTALAAALATRPARQLVPDALPHALRALGAMRATEAFDTILGLLDGPDHPDVPWEVGAALVQIDRARTVAALAARLAGSPELPPTLEERIHTLAAIRGSKAPELLNAVLPLAGDPLDLLRRWAILTVGAIGDATAIAPLVARLEAATGDDPRFAAVGLYRLQRPEAWAHVERVSASHPRPEIRAWLVKLRARPILVGEDVDVELALQSGTASR